jgi:hypothetical protein
LKTNAGRRRLVDRVTGTTAAVETDAPILDTKKPPSDSTASGE